MDDTLDALGKVAIILLRVQSIDGVEIRKIREKFMYQLIVRINDENKFYSMHFLENEHENSLILPEWIAERIKNEILKGEQK